MKTAACDENPPLRDADHGGIEISGGVEMRRAGRVEAEYAVGDAAVQVSVGVERGAEALHETDGADASRARRIGAAASQAGLDRAQHAASHTAEKHRVTVQEEPQPPGKGHHPLTYRHLREHVLDEVGGRLGHAPGRARRAEPATLAGEDD